MRRSRQLPLLMDANVLLDLCESDRNVITVVADTVGPVHVPSPILREELRHLASDLEWGDLGITPVEPELEMAWRAADRPTGLTFHDQLCFLVARERGLRCVTNDGRLSGVCASEGVDTLSGLDLIVKLVEAGGMAAQAAADTGHAMRRANPRFLTAANLEEFLRRCKPPRSGRSSAPRSRR